MKSFGLSKLKTLGLPIIAAGALFFVSPAISEAGSETNLGDRLLLEGKENSQVEELQELLHERGYLDQDAIDGVFDPQTKEAVVEFQTDSDILVDGLAGVQTVGALSILGEGDEGQAVAALQESLQELGYFEADADGEFDRGTHDAVKDFQSAKDILVDGLAGPQTYGTLHAALTGSNETAKEEETTSEEAPAEESTESEEPAQEESSSEEPAQEEATEETTSGSEEESSSEVQSVIEMEATAYTAYCDGCTGITYTGQDLRANPDKKVVAVDPDVIPLGSKVYVEGYGEAIAGDIGGAIKGNRIDLHMATKEEALEFGRQTVEVQILESN
ncbi:peptidoglycan-binding protein [Bacillus sp. H-16]|uniref:peptidoglycan-binding protein n=1 Tax=Alteribacter salitolerans TaxID=2912333 RepID=UPI001965330E|nr:peptidoglycan-binding protein [Alteribacter salitolerans]MBM7097441.1 peptidoglycan-binding protein [Alteribacter salitolerans]